MNIIPLRDVVIVEVQPTHETAAGIQLLDSHKDPAGTEIGTIARFGSGWWNSDNTSLIRPDSKIVSGTKVLFARKHGIAIKGSKTLQCVRYENLLAVIED